MANPSPLRELTLARIRSFVREPEALFWTFGFPIMMALGLGIAFRERGPETAAVGIERGSVAERYAPALRAAGGIWVLPGLIGMNLMSTGLWGMGFGLVQMRQKKQVLRGFFSVAVLGRDKIRDNHRRLVHGAVPPGTAARPYLPQASASQRSSIELSSK